VASVADRRRCGATLRSATVPRVLAAAALAILNTWACSVTVESAGHYLQEDVPGEVARSVAEWHPSRTGAAAAPR